MYNSRTVITAPTQGRYNAARQTSPQGDIFKNKLWLTIGIALSFPVFAQTTTGTIFRVNVTSRTVQAIDYQHRSGSTMLDFAGTSLMPSANGEAKVESKKGYIAIDVEFASLRKAHNVWQ